MLYYDLESHNGADSGGLISLALINEGKAITRFSDESVGDVVYELSINNGMLHIDSNKYDYMCGVGASHMTDYIKGKNDIPLPSAQDVGIVDSKEQSELFKTIVGNKYEDFINMTEATDKEDYVLDGKQASVRKSYLLGMPNQCIYMISPEYIYAAIVTEDSIEYYTNDKNYAEKLPQPMVEWAANNKDLKIIYNYKE